MEAFSTLLSLCAGNSPATVNSPHRGQWRGALMFFFDLRRNKRLSKQPWGWWFKTPSWSLWRQCIEQNVLLTLTSMCLYIYMHIDPYVLCISICRCICVIFILFHWFHYLCPRRTWSLALYFVKHYCTKMLHCYLFPCTLFWQLSIVK